MKSSVKGVARAPKVAVVGYWRGLSYAFKGMSFVYFKHKSLVRYWIFPLLITLVLLAFVMKGVWEFHDELVAWVWEEPTGEGFWEDTLRFLHGFTEVLAALLLVVLGFLTVTLLSSVVAAPFNSALSEEVERLVTGVEGPKLNLLREVKNVIRTILLEVLKLAIYLAVTIPLWVISILIPPISPITSILGFVVTALHAAVDYTDHPQERRGATVGATYAFALRHFLPMFGFGSGVFILIFIPLLNLLLLPAAVAGGTLLFLTLEGESEVPKAIPATTSP